MHMETFHSFFKKIGVKILVKLNQNIKKFGCIYIENQKTSSIFPLFFLSKKLKFCPQKH
jgi:hypothetical protein